MFSTAVTLYCDIMSMPLLGGRADPLRIFLKTIPGFTSHSLRSSTWDRLLPTYLLK